jgi:hypothetical protein
MTLFPFRVTLFRPRVTVHVTLRDYAELYERRAGGRRMRMKGGFLRSDPGKRARASDPSKRARQAIRGGERRA